MVATQEHHSTLVLPGTACNASIRFRHTQKNITFYVNHRNAVCARIRQAKIQHYQNVLQDADQSTAFKAVYSLLNVESSHLLDNDCKTQLCYQFLNLRINAMKIRNETDASETNMSDIETPTQRIVKNLHLCVKC